MAANVQISLGRSNARADTGGTLPLPNAGKRLGQAMVSSGINQVSTIAAQDGEVWTVTVTGGNIYLAGGSATPDATNSARDLILSGSMVNYEAAAGEKLAITDAGF